MRRGGGGGGGGGVLQQQQQHCVETTKRPQENQLQVDTATSLRFPLAWGNLPLPFSLLDDPIRSGLAGFDAGLTRICSDVFGIAKRPKK